MALIKTHVDFEITSLHTDDLDSSITDIVNYQQRCSNAAEIKVCTRIYDKICAEIESQIDEEYDKLELTPPYFTPVHYGVPLSRFEH
jgi:hypothetical protein